MTERPARRRRSSKSVEELKAEIYAKHDEMVERRKKRGPTGAAAEAQEVARKRRNVTKYEQEKAERERKKGSSGYGYSAHMMGGSSRSSGFNPRSVREELLVDYLLEEGFASDEKSAQAIAGAMSEEWKQSIVEGDALRNTIKTLEGKRDAMNREKPGSANTAAPGKQSVGAATYQAYQRLRGV